MLSSVCDQLQNFVKFVPSKYRYVEKWVDDRRLADLYGLVEIRRITSTVNTRRFGVFFQLNLFVKT